MIKIKNSGFTLVEILVALVIGVISIGAIFSSYQYFNQTHKSVSQKAAISQSGREALSVIARDLRNAGYIDPNFVGNSYENLNQTQSVERLINVKNRANNYYGKYRQSDHLIIWYTTSAKDRKQVMYYLKKYNNSNDYYLLRDITYNPMWSGTTNPVSDELFVPYVEDFQVILKGNDGNILSPVCFFCSQFENSRGGQSKGIPNMKNVHTAEVYLTIRSANEVYKENKKTKIVNGESGHGSNITISPDDKYYRETFFISVHTRNLSKPTVASAKGSMTSVNIGTSYKQ